MTPKEKANEFVNGFYQPLGNLKCGVNNTIMWEYAKKYALIAVDYICKIKALSLMSGWNGFDGSELQYWQQVKTEIGNL